MNDIGKINIWGEMHVFHIYLFSKIYGGHLHYFSSLGELLDMVLLLPFPLLPQTFPILRTFNYL